MGASSSREVRRILWLDTEGGIRGVPCWDIAMVNETMQGVKMHRICCAKGVSKRINARLRNSLPDGVSADDTLIIDYELMQDKWQVVSHRNEDKSVGVCLENYLDQYKGAMLCAWGMKTHDNRVLGSILPRDFLSQFNLVDCLLTFKRNLKLPKNSLAADGPGTPRGIFDVKCPPGIGSVHTAHVDALNMRTLCHRAFHMLVKYGEMSPRPNEIYNHSRQETLESVLCLLDNKRDEDVPADVDVHKWGWLLEPHYWEPRKIKTSCAADVRRRIESQLRQQMDVAEIPCDLSDALKTCTTDVQFTRCILDANQYLTQK